ncbi:unnamed protein product, partial [Cyprideis torosa]
PESGSSDSLDENAIIEAVDGADAGSLPSTAYVWSEEMSESRFRSNQSSFRSVRGAGLRLERGTTDRLKRSDRSTYKRNLYVATPSVLQPERNGCLKKTQLFEDKL